MKLLLIFLCCSLFVRAQLYKDPSQPIEARVADLLGRMSASEKAWQLFMVPSDFDTTKCRFTDGIFGLQLFASALSDPTQQILNYSSSNTNLELIARANDIQKHFIENTRLGIPIIFFDEGLHGLVRAQATSFPQAIALAATFDPLLVQTAAQQIAREARLIGIRQVLSPVLNLASDVRWGRTEETFGEDPYLVGVMAALASETGTVGFVGGMDIPLIRKFGCGYAQGVKAVNPDATVVLNMTGTTPTAWNDPVKGAELAKAQKAQGADVIYAAAGGTGIGVLQTAADEGILSIGVDSNQNYMHPGKVLTSMLKRVDNAVYEAFKEGEALTPGFNVMGLANDGVGYAMDENNAALVTPEMQAAVDAAAAQIKSGELVVHDYMSDNTCPAATF